MVDVTYRPIQQWPGEFTKHRRRSNFSASWADTLDLLDRELHYLGARNVIFQIALEEQDFRLNGEPRARAVARHPGVILTLDSKHGPLQYPCDTFDRFQDNVRAVALALESLRRVDRYGVTKHGEQYTGWKAIGSGDPIAMGAPMSIDEAARLLCDATSDTIGEDPNQLARVRSVANSLWREAAKTHHPDAGGDPEMFRRLTEARDLLVAGR